MPFTNGVFVALQNSVNNATPRTVIDPYDFNDLVDDLEGAFNSIGSGKIYTKTDVASATTCNIGAAETSVVRITGTTSITSLGATPDCLRLVYFSGALLLTYNSTALILPGAANITTVAGDSAVFLSDGSGNWRCLAYQRSAIPPGSGVQTSGAFGTDNRLIRSDGTVSSVQASAVTLDDSGNLSGIAHAVVTNGLEAYRASSEGVAIGTNAGINDASDSVNIGFFAGGGAASGSQNVRIGRHAGYDSAGSNGVFLGHAAGQYAYDASGTVTIGYLAGRNASNFANYYTFESVIIGHEAATDVHSGQTSVIIGSQAGKSATDVSSAVMIGYGAGSGATNAQNSILVGKSAGSSLSRNNTLVIEGIDTYGAAGTTGLIYGEFDNRKVVINGTLGTVATVVGSLPAAATAGVGARSFVTDATATTFMSTVSGGGANKVPVVSDGTNWKIG